MAADSEIAVNFNTDVLLEELGGCGRFQVYLTVILCFTSFSNMVSYLVMTYGLYNPGWRCLDNLTFASTNGYTDYDDVNITRFQGETNQTPPVYQRDTCHGFDICQHIEFSPEASTIVTEWGLACGRAWIISTILSIQMSGSLLSMIISGYIGDKYGRKLPFCLSMLFQAIFNLVSIFSISWQMYAVTVFLIGCSTSFNVLGRVLNTEYVDSTWRLRIRSIPDWVIISIIFAFSDMLSQSWKILVSIAVVSGLVALIPLLWVPESMRWLSVRGKEEKVHNVVKKIARINNTEVPHEDRISSLVQQNKEGQKGTKSYTIFHLLRKGYRRTTILLGLIIFLSDVTWYVISFGVSAMPGNIYTNMMLFAVCDLPANIICFFLANKFNRKPTVLSCFVFNSVCLFSVVGVDRLVTGQDREIGILGLVITARVIQYVSWMVMSTFVLELYPTVVRSTVSSYIWLASTIAGVVAPYMIPTNPDLFYVSFLAMAIMMLVCCVLLLFIPETRGKPLKDKW